MDYRYETERLRLCCVDESFAEKVRDFYADNADVFRKSEPYTEDFYSVEKHKAILETEKNLFIKGTMYRYWLFPKDSSQELMGTVSFRNIHWGSLKSCEVGYKMDYKYREMGYCKEALRKLIDVMDREERMHRIEATALPDNTPSVELLKALDFKLVGTIEGYAYIENEWRDHYLFSRINPTMIDKTEK